MRNTKQYSWKYQDKIRSLQAQNIIDYQRVANHERQATLLILQLIDLQRITTSEIPLLKDFCEAKIRFIQTYPHNFDADI